MDGWYAGAGVDYMAYKGTIADIIVGAEYQHIDFMHGNFTSFNGFDDNIQKAKIDTVRARVTFKFNPWAMGAVVAKY
jgi:outer membrane immunogenic protein